MRSAREFPICPAEAGTSVTGRVVARGLADELADHHYLIVDGVDGRSHYVDIGRGEAIEPLADGAIVRLAPRSPAGGETDRRIADIAARNGGRYSVDLHRAADGSASPGFMQSHARRLEAIRRRTGGVERAPGGTWSISPDFLERARHYEALRTRDAPVAIELLSPLPLQRLADHDGATWLDRELVSPAQGARDAGFGREVGAALMQRRAWLIGQGLASLDGQRLVCRPDAIGMLERRELQRVAAAIARDTGLDFQPAHRGARVEGIVRRRVDLASGRFAMIDDGRGFALVPWKPVLERAIGRQVSGRIGSGGAISWTISRGRGIEI
ncbi:DUF3363 domain-containing protein [Sphingomonas sp. URHD0057]|uniref:DUF3363 domain-containing protein n=1 Tax=Sphingomonas sp. URHD0057 TaxID=1380389 RepID=UPI0006889620|nr:DUF3363 domain-containing protein [Sphingomonas sp. URHD0057]